MKTELVGSAKGQIYDYNGTDQLDQNASPFSVLKPIKRNRRHNISFDKTFDFFGFGGTVQQNNINTNNANNGLLSTMNVPQDKSKMFVSAAEAMGMDNAPEPQKSNSIFGRSFGGLTASFHNRHNSASTGKTVKHFETEVDGRFDSLEQRASPGHTFDERKRREGMSMDITMDVPDKQTASRRTNSVSFNFGGNPFHFRRTISRGPNNTDRKHTSRQLSVSIQKNVDQIRRQSSIGNTVT
jgi:hypothetical protein